LILLKTREKSALCGGLLCVGDANFPHGRYVMEGILKLAPQVKDVELHLAMGEALTCCALGPRSPLGRDPWTTSLDEFRPPARDGKGGGFGGKEKKKEEKAEKEDLEWLLDHLLDKSGDTTHPATRQAFCVFLVCLVQYCRAEEAVQKRLMKLQRAFLEFLADSNGERQSP
jgi:proteasome component ECM29